MLHKHGVEYYSKTLAIKMKYKPQNGIFVIKNEGKAIIVKVVIFPVVMYECESWTIKKAEHKRTDAFKLWCWRRYLSPLDCKEIKQVDPKGNKP